MDARKTLAVRDGCWAPRDPKHPVRHRRITARDPTNGLVREAATSRHWRGSPFPISPAATMSPAARAVPASSSSATVAALPRQPSKPLMAKVSEGQESSGELSVGPQPIALGDGVVVFLEDCRARVGRPASTRAAVGATSVTGERSCWNAAKARASAVIDPFPGRR